MLLFRLRPSFSLRPFIPVYTPASSSRSLPCHAPLLPTTKKTQGNFHTRYLQKGENKDACLLIARSVVPYIQSTPAPPPGFRLLQLSKLTNFTRLWIRGCWGDISTTYNSTLGFAPAPVCRLAAYCSRAPPPPAAPTQVGQRGKKRKKRREMAAA